MRGVSRAEATKHHRILPGYWQRHVRQCDSQILVWRGRPCHRRIGTAELPNPPLCQRWADYLSHFEWSAIGEIDARA